MTRSLLLGVAVVLMAWSPAYARRRTLLRRLRLPTVHAKGLPAGLRDEGRHQERLRLQVRRLLPAGPQHSLQGTVHLPWQVLQGPHDLEAELRLCAHPYGVDRQEGDQEGA